MLGVILAAGVGSRLRPLTNNKPKCLVRVCGKPIIQYQIDAYIQAGIRQLVIVVGYEARSVEKYCRTVKGISIRIIENGEYEDTNNMYSLYLARNFMAGKEFILSNGDVTIESSVINNLVRSSEKNAIAVDRGRYNEESMKLVVDEASVVDISKVVPPEQSYGCSIDIYKFSVEASTVLFSEIQEIIESQGRRREWTEVALQSILLDRGLVFYPHDISGALWVEVDNYKDLAQADRIFSGFDLALKEIETVIFDLDGTLYIGEQGVSGGDEVVRVLKSQGKNVFYLSNNSSKSVSEFVGKLKGLGYPASSEMILLSTFAVIDHLREVRAENVFVLGTEALTLSIRQVGIDVDSDNPEYVVVGYDTELTYEKLATACRYINAGAEILATHPDIYCPTEWGPVPDAGAILELLRLTTGVSPCKVFGKPNLEVLGRLISHYHIDPARTLIVGDRLGTDVLLAKNFGAKSLLVLSGSTKREDIEGEGCLPDFVMPSVSSIFSRL